MEIIKRQGKEEKYDERKIYASCYAAALNCHYPEKKSESIAAKTSKKITQWVKKQRGIISSSEIRQQVIKALNDKDVALMYEHHLDLC
ncbi:hypothetical protein KW805_04390 [Candidatus Pacearchaeota archaeon]|nr:hypothetical protein [Candidatus Pacearchaeota archaeon]